VGFKQTALCACCNSNLCNLDGSMNTYKCFYDLGYVEVQADNKEDAAEKAALLFGLGRKSWFVKAYLM
jgi:hypothetical protein